LLTDRSTKTQVDVVGKLTRQFVSEGSGALTRQQQVIAQDIFNLLMARGETIVRSMLAMNLSQSEKLSPELARKMANDPSIEVAGPVLQYSEVLTDEDLMGIIGSMVDSSKLQAIAKRDTVSESVSEMLVSTNLEQVVASLVQNEGAKIAYQTYVDIIQHHKNNEQVVESIFQRSSVPMGVIEKVISNLSYNMKQSLEAKHGDLEKLSVMKKALDQSLEMTSIKMMGFSSSDAELMRLIKQLDKSQKLSPFSALAMCNLQLFEVCMSRILRIPLKNIHILIKDSAGFKVAYERAMLPPALFAPTLIAVRVLRDMSAEGVVVGDESSQVEAVITRMRKLAGTSTKELEQLVALMQHYIR